MHGIERNLSRGSMDSNLSIGGGSESDAGTPVGARKPNGFEEDTFQKTGRSDAARAARNARDMPMPVRLTEKSLVDAVKNGDIGRVRKLMGKVDASNPDHRAIVEAGKQAAIGGGPGDRGVDAQIQTLLESI